MNFDRSVWEVLCGGRRLTLAGVSCVRRLWRWLVSLPEYINQREGSRKPVRKSWIVICPMNEGATRRKEARSQGSQKPEWKTNFVRLFSLLASLASGFLFLFITGSRDRPADHRDCDPTAGP